MINLSNFSERLGELIFDRGFTTVTAFAEDIGIPAPTIRRYKNKERYPHIEILVKIADYFNCSTDYLLGREEENKSLTFKPCPSFGEQITFIVGYFNYTCRRFVRELNISESAFFDWKRGKSIPTIETVEKIAEHFERRIDFILGRES